MRNDANSLAVLVDRRTGEEFSICRYSTSVGRDMGNDFVINEDKTISRQHALIQFVDGKFHVQDLESKNGTRLNGKRISAMVPLRSGDEISLGLTQLIFILIPKHCVELPVAATRTQTLAEPVVIQPPAAVAV